MDVSTFRGELLHEAECSDILAKGRHALGGLNGLNSVHHADIGSPHYGRRVYKVRSLFFASTENPRLDETARQTDKMFYIALVTLLASTYGTPVPIQTYRTNPYILYHNPYVNTGYNQLVQYPVTPVLGKSLQSISSPNQLFFYPSPLPAQPLILNAQSEPTPAITSKFTAPPDGLVQAIYAWFAENNIPIPGELPAKNEVHVEIDQMENSGETTTKPSAGEADVLAEADKNPTFNYPKKFGAPAIKPGQRFYILNGQPQFFGNYQPVYHGVQSVVPQVVQTRNIYPDQNLFVLQQQPEVQTNFQTKGGTPIRNVLFKNADQLSEQQEMNQEQITPVRYHNQNLKPNVLYLRSGQQDQEIKNQAVVQQQYLQGLFPHLNEYQTNQQFQGVGSDQVSQYPIQSQFIPVEVVPPQEKVQQVPYQLSHIAQVPVQVQTAPQPQVSYFQIPVSKDVQAPNYIKSVVPFQINARTKIPEEQTKQDFNLLQENAQSRLNTNEQQPEIDQEESEEDAIQKNYAAVELKRYLADRQFQYGDTVVIDAKNEKEGEDTESEDVTSADLPQEPSIAQAQPGGIALAGPGGVASSSPKGTALAGAKGLAVASPQATAVSGPKPGEKKPSKRN